MTVNNFNCDNIGDNGNNDNDVDDNDVDDNNVDDNDVDDNYVDDNNVDDNDNDNEVDDNDVDDADVADNDVDDCDGPDSRRDNFDRRSSFRETDPCIFQTSNRYLDTSRVDRRARRDPEPDMRPEAYPEMVKSIPGVSNPQFYCHTWDQCYKTFFVRDLRILILRYSVCQTRLEKLTNDKHSNLLWKSVIYGQKKFYNIGPWDQCYKTFYRCKL
jgi:hypothetical protein